VEGLAPLIQVFDMPTSVAFYRDILGFTVVNQSEPGDNFDWGMLLFVWLIEDGLSRVCVPTSSWFGAIPPPICWRFATSFASGKRVSK
jgi:catechol 2,3-dioxygenase-like lactoylglutathione lyase family enzyme